MKSIVKSLLPSGLLLAAGATLAACTVGASAQAGDTYGTAIPQAKVKLASAGQGPQTAVLAGGCFWGMEEVFQHVKGVTDVVSGYAGGDKAHANYRDSSSGRYGDAEAVKITYNPQQISYAKLLQVYFSVAHDPTQIDRQGPDVGSQYRSEVFASNADQARVAQDYIHQLASDDVYKKPIATQVSVGKNFFPAEAYHQNYAANHPDSYYIQINDAPKVAAVKTRFASLYQSPHGQETASIAE